MLRALPFVLLAAAAAPAFAQQAPALAGAVDGNVYASPTGEFKMEVPVLPSLGGAIRDTDNVVTFRDSYGLQISVSAFAHDATQKWQLSTRGIKEYLIYYFGSYVLPDFKRFCAGTTVESAGFSSDLMEGALFAYILLPGGSMFEPKPAFGQIAAPGVAKRGNLLFVRNGFSYVISTELSERVTEGAHYHKTTEEEDQALRARLVDVVKKMQFTRPALQEKPVPALPAPST